MARLRKSDSPERHRRVEEVFHAALDIEPALRGEYLATACGSDTGLRREVEELIEFHERDTTRLDRTPVDALVSEPVAGDLVGHYELDLVMGEGGMGRIWRARDRRLDRWVAIKFLLRTGPDAFARFQQEARAVSALDHPNICTIYDAGTDKAGRLYLVMAWYEGETLAERRHRGLMPWREGVDLAMQTARGLGKAHDHGLIHCDVKPSNLFLTRDGLLKILDFGIARLLRAPGALGGEEDTMGTARYMAPEQVRAEALDARADIWALGVVLYELLCGRRAFVGESTAATLDAVLNAEPPPLSRLRPDLPTALAETVSLMLSKDRGSRPRSMQAVLDRLESLPAATQSGARRLAADPEVHALYLRGRSMLNLAPADALAQFRAALALDEQFAEAAVGAAEAHLLIGMRGLAAPAEKWRAADAAAATALELDPDSGCAHALRAAVRGLRDRDWEASQEGFEKALALAPGDAAVRCYYCACCLLPLGMLQEARAEMESCVQMDPHAPVPQATLALTHWLSGNMDQASRHAGIALVQAPGTPEPVIILAFTRLKTQAPAAAVARLQPLLDSLHDPGLTLALRALAAGRDEAGRLADELEYLARSVAVLPTRHAWAQMAAGRMERACRHLDEAFEQQEYLLNFLAVSQLFSPLQDRPEFTRIRQRLNL